MINIISATTYYFPVGVASDNTSFTLRLYSDLSKNTTEFNVQANASVSSDNYFPIVITQFIIDAMPGGEYNYYLLTNDIQVSKGLLRITKDDNEGEYDPAEDYVVYGVENEWITTNVEDGQSLWQSGYTSGYTAGVNSVPLTSIEINKDGLYTNEEGGWNSVVVNTSIPQYDGLVFKAYGGQATITMFHRGFNPNLKYTLDGGETWTQWDYNGITLQEGEEVMFIGNNRYISKSNVEVRFVTEGNVYVSGNIMGLLDGGYGTATTITHEGCFSGLFINTNIEIETEGALRLPATTLTDYCYYDMFKGCTSLTTAPVLPATKLVLQCYEEMFMGCTGLTSVTTYASNISASGCLTEWLNGVSQNGEFYNLGGATYSTGVSGIPNGWLEYRIQPYTPS